RSVYAYKSRIRKGNMKGKHQDTKALSDVLAEMQRQDAKWGADRNQDPFIWGAILGEEVEEFHQAVLHDRFGGKAAGTSREEAVQIAAVALQIIEYYDRVID
ncbi:MazG-like family protein, partial [Escherichia coli]